VIWYILVERFIAEVPRLVAQKDLQGADSKRGICLSWWRDNQRRFPLTHQLALKVLTAQATESDVERNYSHARHILESLRASMSAEMFHMILFLYENRPLWAHIDPAAIFGY
jgi:hypothetical protein